MDRDDFYLNVAHALSGCQLVEQALKLYITEALALAKKRIGNWMIFKMDGQDYEDSPLGKLIEVFKKFTDNDTLVSELKRFTAERNFLSHKGITHCLDYVGELDWSAATEFRQRLDAIQDEALRLTNAIHVEGGPIRVSLDFGDLTEAG